MSLINFNNRSFIPNNWSTALDSFFDDDHFFDKRKRTASLPATNIEETDSAFVVKMAVPGVDKDKLNVEVKDNLLIISSEMEDRQEEEEKNFTRREYSFQSFKRSFALPDNVDEGSIKAIHQKGELVLTLPKSEVETKKSKQIAID
ncbi:MAG TPA: Hsp20/alpha crystallin family protein [Saprospiraceae bacterium]|nr:Hsp20/alpha crystallin family protein [Saprospiraceae bacterium]